MAPIEINKVMADRTVSPEDRVKIAIMWEDGDNNPDPTQLDTMKNMSDFSFSNEHYISLTKHFNLIIKSEKPGADLLAVVDIQVLIIVQDCINAVNTAIK